MNEQLDIRAAEFYALRDRRTEEYMQFTPVQRKAVHVVVDSESARSAPGQLALLALLNQMARVHRKISISIADICAPVLVDVFPSAEKIGDAALATVRNIDPFGDFSIVDTAPLQHALSIGLGKNCQHDLDWYIGAQGTVGQLSKTPELFDSSAGALLGAAAAACLGAAAIFREAHNLTVQPRALSAWNYGEAGVPESIPDLSRPIDVGRVLVVGAGAVASALAYWVRAFGGISSPWHFVDADLLAAHNTNRGLTFFPGDTEWNDNTAAPKARILANYLSGATAESEWYHQSNSVDDKFDICLCLANEYSARQFVARRNFPIVLQATTGANWLSQIHRHILGVDDCPECRNGEEIKPVFECSVVPIESQQKKSDAALPFLSAASGLMLATALQKLQCGNLANLPRNDWRWDFASNYKMTSNGVRSCRQHCSNIYNVELRQLINQNSIWRGLIK